MDLGRREALLRLETVSKTYVDGSVRSVNALQNVDFTLNAGEMLSIVGPSGCGKTTILRLAAGLDFPTSGRISYRGRPVTAPAKDRAMVFQSYSAFPWLSIRENIAFGLENRSDCADEVNRWLKATGLTEFAGSYPKALSGGMRQRIAIARAMIVAPRLVLLDEPFGALDEYTRASMRNLLLSVAEATGCSVMLVTHDLREALLLSDRVIILSPRPGRVLDVVETSLPKPRHSSLLGTSGFGNLYQRLAATLVQSAAAEAGAVNAGEAREAH